MGLRRIELIDGRKVAQRKIADGNIKRVSDWMDKNPNGTIPECHKALKLSYWTVYRIVKQIKEKD